MIYTKEFNKFFESFDTGNKTPEELELIKTDMFSGWEARQSEIDELKRKCKILIEKGLEQSKRISELESDNEELRHILRQSDSY